MRQEGDYPAMKTRSQASLQRRDLFRLVGAGAAVAFSSHLASGTPTAASEAPRIGLPSCWHEVNDVDAERRRQWQQRMEWFQESKFGMFIHWGPCSLASVEISWPIMRPNSKWHITQDEYENLYKRFNPVKYDPEAWVELAKAAGQRYMVFTTKHHDGFCMFDSSFTDYKITNTPYKKDIVRMLADACRGHDMPLGFYYSPPDMHHPAYRDTSKLAKENWHGEPTRPEWLLYLDYMGMQVRELLCRYGPAVVIWFDGLDHQEKYDGYRFVRMIREFSPSTLVNNRIGVPGDYDTPEQFVPMRIPVKGVRIAGGDRSAEKQLPEGLPRPEDFKPWETCMTINDTWAYNKNDRDFKPLGHLIRTLVDVVSKGGNLLLNVGPTPEGTIQPEFEEKLRGIGQWLKVNGDAIYGTTYGPLQNLPWGKTTAKGKTVYLHIFEWPRGSLELKGLGAVSKISLLSGGQPLRFQQDDQRLTIQLPDRAPDPYVSVLECLIKV